MDGFMHGLYNNPRREIGVDGEHTCKDMAALKNPTLKSDSNMSSHSPETNGDPCGPLRHYVRPVLGLHLITNGSSKFRRKREFIPEDQKDYNYWFKRKRNNEAAKRSRQRRKMEEMLLEGRAVALLRENEKLRATLSAVQYRAIGVEHPHHRFGDSFSGQGISPYCFHPPSTDVPTAPHMLPTAALSFGTTLRMAKHMSDSGYTDFSGLTQTHIVPSDDPCVINNDSDAFQQFHRPGSKDSLSGSAVSNSCAPPSILNGYTCHGNAGVGYSFAPNSYAFDARYNTPQSAGTPECSFPATPTCIRLPRYSARRGHHAQGTNLGERTRGKSPDNFDHINPSPEGRINRSNQSNDGQQDQTAVAKAGSGTMFPLPHKLRYKMSKAIREESLGATKGDDNVCGYVDGNIGKLSKGTSMSPSNAFDYIGADGLLKQQLASLYAEVKTLKKIVLTKSN